MKITYTTEDYAQHQKNVDNMEGAKCAVRCDFCEDNFGNGESVTNEAYNELLHRASNVAWQKEQMREEV